MTAQPADRIPASGPDTGLYEVIHRGGQAAVVVRLPALQALEQAVPPPATSGLPAQRPDLARREQDLPVSVALCASVADRKVTGSGAEGRALSGRPLWR
jgi:hypothetical protein